MIIEVKILLLLFYKHNYLIAIGFYVNLIYLGFLLVPVR